MNELDNLKSIWKNQEISPEQVNRQDKSIHELLERQRNKIRKTNVFASFCMFVTSVYLLTLMFNYPEEAPLFYISLSAVIVVMGIALAFLWKRSLSPSSDLSEPSGEYIAQQLKRLKRNKLIIQLSPVYGFLLGIMINAYAYSLMEHASSEFVFWMTNINWAYIFLISYLTYIFKMRRFRKNVEPLIADLEELKKELDIKIR